MYSLRVFVTIALLSCHVAAWWSPTIDEEIDKKTVYIDASCETKDYEGGAFANGWFHALGSSHEVIERVASHNDHDYHAVVKRIMKRVVSDEDDETQLDEIMKYFEQLSVLSIIDSLKDADIRIFCDDDAVSTKENPNTRMVFVGNDRLEDRYNFMAINIRDSCRYVSADAFTVIGHYRIQTLWNGQTAHGQKSERMVISICKRGLQPMQPPFNRYWQGGMMTQQLANDYGINWMQNTAAHIIVHELMHALSDGQIFDLPNAAAAYGWRNVENMDQMHAEENADSYAFMADAALLAPDWTITRLWAPPGCPPNVVERETSAKFGQLAHYADRSRPTKRMVLRSTGNETEQSIRVRSFLEADPRFIMAMDEDSGISRP
ncbi:hypothetical protein BDV96DRAFT_645324 [Lophiotrema nucula]|uniref:Lysine-specific metallo-endopeptidase domain-containing protein n=1 Tax=Lophiotrema nucula TaxID=690887 RepID=A0A6A5ZCK0_9PLEO|nr:hypothetical protein BDV96DRAFT_645324 [Lophiotrema nucula]